MYESIIIQFDLATRDQHIDNVKQQIRQKQSFLMNKSREIKQSVKNNKYLEIVKKEYDDYIFHLAETKKKQLEAFKKISSHTKKNNNLLEFQEELNYKIKQLEKELKELH
jgi:peptidoglycan hydrolase CwlO-like protein